MICAPFLFTIADSWKSKLKVSAKVVVIIKIKSPLPNLHLPPSLNETVCGILSPQSGPPDLTLKNVSPPESR